MHFPQAVIQLTLLAALTGALVPSSPKSQRRHVISGSELSPSTTRGVSKHFLVSLDRAARLAHIVYCTGSVVPPPAHLTEPFNCGSHCDDPDIAPPNVHLLHTWERTVGAVPHPSLTGSCGYVAVDHYGRYHPRGGGKGQIVVVFRGTYSFADVVADLSTKQQEYIPYPGEPERPGNGGRGGADQKGKRGRPEAKSARCHNCTVHMGFMASWRAARHDVIPVVKAARKQWPGYGVHLIGHSLGGAVAALAALEMKIGLGWEDVSVTTFGEPRIGNEGLAHFINWAFELDYETAEGRPRGKSLLYRRVTHVGDPVPLLPPGKWGYHSHAGEVYISKSELPPEPKDLHLCRGDDDRSCIAGCKDESWLLRILGWFKNRKRLTEAEEKTEISDPVVNGWIPAALKFWDPLYAHRDYFYRLGLCVPDKGPLDWWRGRHNVTLEEGNEPADL